MGSVMVRVGVFMHIQYTSAGADFLIFILFVFQPPAPLALPYFKGCIEFDTLNEEVLSLYNFENIFNLNTTVDKPCGR